MLIALIGLMDLSQLLCMLSLWITCLCQNRPWRVLGKAHGIIILHCGLLVKGCVCCTNKVSWSRASSLSWRSAISNWIFQLPWTAWSSFALASSQSWCTHHDPKEPGSSKTVQRYTTGDKTASATCYWGHNLNWCRQRCFHPKDTYYPLRPPLWIQKTAIPH